MPPVDHADLCRKPRLELHRILELARDHRGLHLLRELYHALPNLGRARLSGTRCRVDLRLRQNERPRALVRFGPH
eukprot:224132-Lingulodinium_polyedra.AAC.1